VSTEIQTLFILLVVYQLKHFFADYIFQYNYMLKKIRPGWDFVAPLSLHCAVHGAMTLAVCMIYRPSMWWLGLLDFAIHFLTDRIRSGPRYLGRYTDIHASIFWWILGFDQMIHHLTHLLIIAILLYA
jgi:hypothetical protein